MFGSKYGLPDNVFLKKNLEKNKSSGLFVMAKKMILLRRKQR